MNLVDDIDLEFPKLRRVAHLIDQAANVFHGIVGCSVEFKNVECVFGAFFKSVDQAGDDTSAGSFSDTTWSAEQKCLRKFIVVNGIFERSCNVLLSNYFFKACGP